MAFFFFFCLYEREYLVNDLRHPFLLGFLQTAASPTPGHVRGKSKSAIPTQGNYGLLDISKMKDHCLYNIRSFSLFIIVSVI